jgi:hypothetical protein
MFIDDSIGDDGVANIAEGSSGLVLLPALLNVVVELLDLLIEHVDVLLDDLGLWDYDLRGEHYTC